MTEAIKNLRIHFYGVQGSGSVYPRLAERRRIREWTDAQLLQQVFARLQSHSASGQVSGQVNVHDMLGAAITPEALAQFRSELDLPDAPSFGGWTTCVRIETSDGFDIVIDCGSGFRLCAQDLQHKWGERAQRNLYILGSHAHFDHTEGFDQSSVCFDPRNHIHFFANRSYLLAMDRDLGIFTQHADRTQEGRPTPLAFDMMPARFAATEIKDIRTKPDHADDLADTVQDIEQAFQIGKTRIQAFEVFHPDPCLAYRIEHNGKVFVFCTDHELRRGDDPNFHLQVKSLKAESDLVRHAQNADVLYRDGQYLRAEYDAEKALGGAQGVSRKDWGHSCIEDIVLMAQQANVKQTYIGHHDPLRSWEDLCAIDDMLRQQSLDSGRHIELAKAETVIDL